MRTAVVLLSLLAFGSSTPLPDTPSNRVQEHQADSASSASGENELNTRSSEVEKLVLARASDADGPKTSIYEEDRYQNENRKGKAKARAKLSRKRSRKHKAIFFNYPLLAQLPYAGLPNYDLDYSNEYLEPGLEQRTRAGSNRYQESNIFYIRLPPTPYMFVPGLGYISQPPTYSTAGLRPQVSYARPTPTPTPTPTLRPVYHQSGNPLIQLPIDFVSNGKPTSVYQYQKKPPKKPTDTPITNLDSLSADFVSNGKPTSIYQWQAGLKPARRPDHSPNNLDKGPYAFNGKPTSFYLLKPDGTATAHQSIRYQDYQQDSSSYY